MFALMGWSQIDVLLLYSQNEGVSHIFPSGTGNPIAVGNNKILLWSLNAVVE